MRPYLLLTPGPLTTSESVKTAMMTDWCTWDEDYNVHIVEEIRKGLVQLATRKTDEYTSILMQGSGTYCVEATLGSVITPKHKLLILSNGAYGERMGNRTECESLYRAFGKTYSRLENWSCYILTSHEQFETLFGKKANKKRKLYNGMLKCNLYQYWGEKPPKR